MTELNSSRLFILYSYSSSHRTLFLRSNPDRRAGFTTSVEIYMGHVDLMYIKPIMYGLKMWRPAREDLLNVKNLPDDDIERIYLLQSGEFQGFIKCDQPSWREAEGYMDEDGLFI